mmetsp:Transcript_29452/g.96955  ORF Transcript_29452/g.96955 Transcript_29452/m.96955 type:complete len:358 (-) Transcript_29452:108-1181(-)
MPRRRRPLSRRHGVRAMLLAHHAQRRRALAAHPRGGKDDVGPVCVKQPRHRRRCRPAARAARAAVLLRRRARGQDRAARVHRVLRAGVAAQARGAGRLLRRVLRVADGAALLHPLQFGSLLLQRPRRRAAPRPGSARGHCRRAGAGALLRAPAVERLSARARKGRQVDEVAQGVGRRDGRLRARAPLGLCPARAIAGADGGVGERDRRGGGEQRGGRRRRRRRAGGEGQRRQEGRLPSAAPLPLPLPGGGGAAAGAARRGADRGGAHPRLERLGRRVDADEEPGRRLARRALAGRSEAFGCAFLQGAPRRGGGGRRTRVCQVSRSEGPGVTAALVLPKSARLCIHVHSQRPFCVLEL